ARQEPLLLLVGARELDRQRAKLLDGDDQAARRTDLRELLDRDEGHDGARAEAAELLVVEDSEELVLAEELDDVPRELGLPVDLRRPRSDALACECPDEIADLALLVGERIDDHAASLTRTNPPNRASKVVSMTRLRLSLGAFAALGALALATASAGGSMASPRRLEIT